MKIFFDHQIFELQSAGGISRYFFELISHLDASNEATPILPFMYSNNIYIRSNSFFTKFIKKNPFPLRIYKLIHPNKMKSKLQKENLWTSIEILKKSNFDVFHPTYYDPSFLNYLGSKPFVLTIHDLIYAKYFQTGKTLENIKLLAEKAAKIIAVSENTKKDILQILKIPNKRIEVIYHGGAAVAAQGEKPIEINTPENYILFVGRRRHYKNFNFFVASISSLLLKYPHLFLVCVGKKFSRDEINLFNKLHIKKKIKQIYPKNDKELSAIYKKATALCLPSKYEGFGLPILEAFANNCPVITSNTSSLPEVAGEAAIYFDPKSQESITEAVEKVLKDTRLRETLVELGRKRLENFSWQKTATETLNLYSKVLMMHNARMQVGE